jgi:hypothetical protein
VVLSSGKLYSTREAEEELLILGNIEANWEAGSILEEEFGQSYLSLTLFI